MRERVALGMEHLAFMVALIAVAWGPLAQGSTLAWGMAGLTGLGSTALALTLLASGVRGVIRLPHPLWAFVALAFLAWVWASTTWAPDKVEAWRWAGVWTGVLGAALSLHFLTTTRIRQGIALGTMVLTGAAALAVAYLQTRGYIVPGFVHYPGIPEKLVSGPYYNPSHFSGYLIPLAALTMSLILFTRVHLHTVLLLGLLMLLHWLNIKTDASSIPAVLLASALPILVWLWTRSRIAGIFLTTVSIGASVALVLLLVTPGGQATFEAHKHQIGISKNLDRFVQQRQACWRYGREMWFEHFYRGVGPGQFILESAIYRAKERHIQANMDRQTVNYAHSDILQAAAETGVVGLIHFLVLLLLPLTASRRTVATLIAWSATPAIMFAGIYDGHLTVVAGTMITVFCLSGLAVSQLQTRPKHASETNVHRSLETVQLS